MKRPERGEAVQRGSRTIRSRKGDRWAWPRDLGLPAAKACVLDHDPEAAVAWLKTIPPQFLPASIQSDPDFAAVKDARTFSRCSIPTKLRLQLGG